jgi:cell division protease FtsH
VTLPSPPGPPPPGPPTPGQSGPSATPPRAGLPGRIWWSFFLVLLVWNAIALFGTAGNSVEVPYSTFLAQAQQDNVDQVTFNGQALAGTFRHAVQWPPASAPPASAVPGSSEAAPASTAPGSSEVATPGSSQVASPGLVGSPGSSPGISKAAPPTYTSFTTVEPPLGDPVLLPLLESHGVTIIAKNAGGSSFLLDLILGILPVALIIGVIVYMGRQMQRSQAGIFGFGGSRARLYDAERPKVTFADVAGEDEAKTELAEVVDFLKTPDRYKRLGARLPRGVLLIGPPGTGKTLLARAVAGEAHVPFFSISGSEFVELFVGVGASRVRDLFTKAKAAAPAIVFVDEIDAVGRQRGAGLGGGNDEREQTLNQLLVEMDGFDAETNIIVIAATNRPDVLDPALLRPGRFDRQVTVGFPDRAGREAILRIHTKNLPLAPTVDLGIIARATPGFSGADLANLANEAALRAARAGRDQVGPEEFEEALDTVSLGTRQAGLTNEDERWTVAFHEGGHAIVARLTPGADPVQKVTIVPHGQALGVTEQRPMDDRRNYPLDYLLGRLAVMLGGRAAEEIVFGQPTTGAESDLKQATELARRMVGLWGMSEELGPVSFGVGETQPFLGRELAAPREFAEATAARIDAAVTDLISSAHDQARAVLGHERAGLDALAAELVAHEVVSAARIDEILALAGTKLPGPAAGSGSPPRVGSPAPKPARRVAATRAVGRSKATRAGKEPRG